MFTGYRIRRIHERFLASCRNLSEGRAYWNQADGFLLRALRLVLPVPLLGLHADGQDLLSALEWLEANYAERMLGEDVVLHYHSILYKGKEEWAGRYRKRPIHVVGSSIPRAGPERVRALMKQLDLKLRKEQAELAKSSPPERRAVLRVAVDLYQRLGWIHPFEDGNGRAARLAMNHLTRRHARGYVILPPLSEASSLWEALQEAHCGRLDPLTQFAESCFVAV